MADVVENRRVLYERCSNNPDTSKADKEKRQRLSPEEEARRNDLEKAICLLHEQLQELQRKKKEQEETMKEALSMVDSNAAIEACMKRKDGPLCRLTSTSDEDHRKQSSCCQAAFWF